jgi:aminoglycoside phosphotransferase (APT) family kinase protein
MSAPSASQPAPEQLAAALAPVLGGSVVVDGLHRLTGGASRETWAFAADGVDLILRRDPPRRANAPHVMRLEADAMRACRRAGLRAPEVLVHDDGTLLGTAGLIMRRVPGETIARRILRDDEFAGARRSLVADLGTFLAGLHAIEPAEVPGVATRTGLDGLWQSYERVIDRSPTFEKAYEWLAEHPPPPSEPCLVHGDLRLGNLIVGPDGLEAVIDWELIHVGDPLEDLAWLCLKAWRFGGRLEVAGLGTIEELITAYESAGGRRVDRDALRWWLVDRTLIWGIGCMTQATVHLSGAVRSVDLAAVGRRAAEQEWDLLELLAPDACEAALAAPLPPERPDDASRYGRPTARELLEAVREWLTDDVVARGDPGLGYHARVAANVLAIVERELSQQPVDRDGDDWATLALAVRDRLLVANPKHLSRAAAG